MEEEPLLLAPPSALLLLAARPHAGGRVRDFMVLLLRVPCDTQQQCVVAERESKAKRDGGRGCAVARQLD